MSVPQAARQPVDSLRFDRPILSDGYRWWYLDALSDDGRHGITIIAFLGSVFSPHYAAARRRGPADPLQHCCMHVALYGPRGAGRWAMTERGAQDVLRYGQALTIGLSAVLWDGSTLSFGLDEITAPLPRRLRGTVRVHVPALTRHTERLDAPGRHRWSPLAPGARVEVDMTHPALRWAGPGYLDSNEGDEPLEAAFRDWTWSRAPMRRGAAVLYDVRRCDGTTLDLALRIAADGRAEAFAGPPVAELPPTLWRLPRRTRADPGHGGARPEARVLRTLTDAPFYARSVLRTRLLGEEVTALHEALSMRRFVQPWVQLMLPFRAPRAWW